MIGHFKPAMGDYNQLFLDGGRYHTETSPLICCSNQWTDFYMITASVMNELTLLLSLLLKQTVATVCCRIDLHLLLK